MPVRRPVLIVEGGGDMAAVPLLFRRVVAGLGIYEIFPASNPIQVGDASVLDRPDQLEKFIVYASSRSDGDSVLVALDFDVFGHRCVVEVVTAWTERIRNNCNVTKPVAICFFVREFESLILASIVDVVAAYPQKSWRTDQAVDFDNAESIRGAKETIAKLIRAGSYKPSVDQARFTSAVSLEKLEAVRGFRRFKSAILWLYDWAPGDGFCNPS